LQAAAVKGLADAQYHLGIYFHEHPEAAAAEAQHDALHLAGPAAASRSREKHDHAEASTTFTPEVAASEVPRRFLRLAAAQGHAQATTFLKGLNGTARPGDTTAAAPPGIEVVASAHAFCSPPHSPQVQQGPDDGEGARHGSFTDESSTSSAGDELEPTLVVVRPRSPQMLRSGGYGTPNNLSGGLAQGIQSSPDGPTQFCCNI
jgi:hypothetical protein